LYVQFHSRQPFGSTLKRGVARRSFGLLRRDLLLQIDPSVAGPSAGYILRSRPLITSFRSARPAPEDPRGYGPFVFPFTALPRSSCYHKPPPPRNRPDAAASASTRPATAITPPSSATASCPHADELSFPESAAGYDLLRQRLQRIQGTVGEGAFIDFGHLKRQLPLTRVLDQVGWSARLKGTGAQRRGACPLHRGDGRGRTFSVNLDDDVFQCFDAQCAKKGDVIDLWAALHGLSLRAAALDLVQTFGLEPAPGGTEKRNG
jgi:CHC2 zinc finger